CTDTLPSRHCLIDFPFFNWVIGANWRSFICAEGIDSMKRFTVAAFASAIVLTFAVDAHSAPMNLLTNPGFETGDFTGWTVGGNRVSASVETDGTPIPGVYVNFDPTVQNVRNGNYAGSALVALGASSASTAIAEVLTLTQTVNVLAGESYIISFFLG